MSEVDPKGRGRNHLGRIQREIREWTARPPARTPAAARTRVLARIEERPARGWLLAAVASAAVVVLAAGLLLRGPVTPSGPVAASSDSPPASRGPAGGAGLLVYELESGTKLYLALAAPPVVDLDDDDNDC